MTGLPPPLPHELLGDIRAMIVTVDERARDINKRWGHNRLPHLVPFDWLDKFRSQKRKWETACFECAGSPRPEDRDTVRKHGEAMLRAFDKLEEIAVADGHMPESVSWWEFELADGTPVILVRDRHEMTQLPSDLRTRQVWSLEEIAAMVGRMPELLGRAKDMFPGAEVIQIRTSSIVTDALDDALSDLPFA